MSSTTSVETEGHLKRALGVPALVLFGMVYMVPLTVYTTYGIVTQLTGGRLHLCVHPADVWGADRLPRRLVAAARLSVLADAELPGHRHLPGGGDPGGARLGIRAGVDPSGDGAQHRRHRVRGVPQSP